MNRVIGYERASPHKEDAAAQMKVLESAGCNIFFIDKQADDNVGKLQELVMYAQEGDIVVVAELGRMGRSLRAILATLRALQEKGVSVRTLDGKIDTSSEIPMRQAMSQLLSVFSEIDHRATVDRLQTGRKRTGRKGGRKKLLDDFQILEIQQKMAEGASKRKLAEEFGVSRATIMRAVWKTA